MNKLLILAFLFFIGSIIGWVIELFSDISHHMKLNG